MLLEQLRKGQTAVLRRGVDVARDERLSFDVESGAKPLSARGRARHDAHQIARLRAFAQRPHLVVASGSGGVHAYWRILRHPW